MEAVLSKSDILSSRLKPQMRPVDFDRIPDSLKNDPRWPGWDLRRRKCKWDKPPIDAQTGGPGGSNAANTWCDFEAAREAYEYGRVGGVGFALGDGYVGIDLDDCRNVETGEFNALALE